MKTSQQIDALRADVLRDVRNGSDKEIIVRLTAERDALKAEVSALRDIEKQIGETYATLRSDAETMAKAWMDYKGAMDCQCEICTVARQYIQESVCDPATTNKST